MVSQFVFAVLGFIAVASQANGACLPKPPPSCGCGGSLPTAPTIDIQTLSALLGPSWGQPSNSPCGGTAPAPVDISALWSLLAPSLGQPGVSLPAPGITWPLPQPPAIPCPVPVTQVNDKPDVTIPVSLPNEIPVGKFCTCQKFSIKPALVPCVQTPGTLPAPGASNPGAILSNILGSLSPTAPSSSPSIPWTPVPSPSPCGCS